MNPTVNNAGQMVEALNQAATQIGNFLTQVQGQLTPEAKAELDKALGGDGALAQEMAKANAGLKDAMEKLNNFSKK